MFAGVRFFEATNDSVPRQAWRWLDALDVVDRVLVARRLGLSPSEDLELDLEVELSSALDAWSMLRALGLRATDGGLEVQR